jgi:hypothetical protein
MKGAGRLQSCDSADPHAALGGRNSDQDRNPSRFTLTARPSRPLQIVGVTASDEHTPPVRLNCEQSAARKAVSLRVALKRRREDESASRPEPVSVNAAPTPSLTPLTTMSLPPGAASGLSVRWITLTCVLTARKLALAGTWGGGSCSAGPSSDRRRGRRAKPKCGTLGGPSAGSLLALRFSIKFFIEFP